MSGAKSYGIGDWVGVNGTRVLVKNVFSGFFQTDQIIPTEIEVLQPLFGVQLAVGDKVEILFHRSREFVVEHFPEIVFQETNDGEGNPFGNQSLAALGHIALIGDVRHDAGIGGWTTNAIFF